MRIVVQRVKKASVTINDHLIDKIGSGLLVFVGIGKNDTFKDIKYMADKITGLRIFEDLNSKMNLSVLDKEKEVLIISQFTLYGDVRKGKRPSFSNSASPKMGEELYNNFIEEIKKMNIVTKEGRFGADMDIELINDGPVTILLDSEKKF